MGFISLLESVGYLQQINQPTHNFNHTLNLVLTYGVEPPEKENSESEEVCPLLLIYRLIFAPTLTYGHELSLTERTGSRVQAAKMIFLRRVSGLSLRDRVRSSAIREELGVEPLLLRVERNQMRWLVSGSQFLGTFLQGFSCGGRGGTMPQPQVAPGTGAPADTR
ncbi:hypothetical protein D4764_06G0006400 [Takifugu flavidus]|uniref:Uncharacterized protein n=1 Tax=Takifugu flavidus TaxID=433684 RepID=A0A5C6N075_9TELE|nr:hypothetical protein D4764_06G0006400 [Takifugu flavidus]